MNVLIFTPMTYSMMRSAVATLLVAFLVAIATSACTKLPEVVPDACELERSMTDDGWLRYAARDYRSALALFDEAQRQGCSETDGYNGKGWAYARMDSLNQALAQFTSSIDRELSVLDALAGRSAVRLGLGDYEHAIEDAERVIAAMPGYRFPRDASVDARDLHLVIAQASYHLAVSSTDPRKAEVFYGKIQREIDLLFPGNGLDQSRPATWRYGERSFASYDGVLLAVIEALGVPA